MGSRLNSNLHPDRLLGSRKLIARVQNSPGAAGLVVNDGTGTRASGRSHLARTKRLRRMICSEQDGCPRSSTGPDVSKRHGSCARKEES